MEALSMDLILESPRIMKAVKTVSILAGVIAGIAAVASYGTQVVLLLGWQVGGFSYVIPATVDFLAIISAIGLHIRRIDKSLKRVAAFVLITAGSVSMTANLYAGATLGSKIAHAWTVIAYMLAEWLNAKIRAHGAKIELELARQKKAEEAAKIVEPVHATATLGVAQGAVSATTATVKPGSAKSRILELAASTPQPTVAAIAGEVGVKPAWVKHVIKTSTTS